MCLESRTSRGNRVVVLGGARLTSLKGWVAEVDIGALKARQGAADALLMDFRSPGFTPGAKETNALVWALVALCAEQVPPVAILTNPGPQYGGARMLCALGELRGCVAAAFQAEDEAWAWLHEQLDEDLGGAAAPVPASRSGLPEAPTCLPIPVPGWATAWWSWEGRRSPSRGIGSRWRTPRRSRRRSARPER